MNTSRATAFRANDAAAAGREEAIHYFSRYLKQSGEREAAATYIDTLTKNYGPVVDGYPSWHPFTRLKSGESMTYDPKTEPHGFEGLDHTIYFRDAFVTAPYGGADRVIESVREKRSEYIDAEEIRDVPLYNYGATPVLVICEGIPKELDGTISKRFALGSMLSNEVPEWDGASCGESWETMRRYILGTPCGSRSSLFVNQETGKALREVFILLNQHGLWGPVHR